MKTVQRRYSGQDIILKLRGRSINQIRCHQIMAYFSAMLVVLLVIDIFGNGGRSLKTEVLRGESKSSENGVETKSVRLLYMMKLFWPGQHNTQNVSLYVDSIVSLQDCLAIVI
uniref:Uncharacterized protein n=1 Tax=Arundo donax TaxID=35708 RepID=A0A0A9FVP7_ARUDO